MGDAKQLHCCVLIGLVAKGAAGSKQKLVKMVSMLEYNLTRCVRQADISVNS